MPDPIFERYKEALKAGHVAVLRGRSDEAIAHYREAAEFAPDRPLPHSSLGGVLVREGRLDEALAAYARALGRAPRDEAALSGRADALQGSSELGLEDDDEGEEADDGPGLQDLREELESEELSCCVDDVEGDDADDEAHGARAPDEAEEPVEEERREDDVDDRDRLDLYTGERVQEAVHRRPIVA